MDFMLGMMNSEMPLAVRIFGESGVVPFKFWGSIALFIAVIAALFFRRRISPAVTVLVGVAISLLCSFTTFRTASESIDLNALFLIISMMITTRILSDSGFFEWAVVGGVKLFRGNMVMIMTVLFAMTFFFSAFLDNVTTIMIMAPLGIIISRTLFLPAPVMLFSILMAANLGGASSLLGGAQSMIIGAQTDLMFNDFIRNAAPCAAVTALVMIMLLSGGMLLYSPSVKSRLARVCDFTPSDAIVNPRRMFSAFIVFVIMIIMFALQGVTGIEPGVTGMIGTALMLALYRPETKKLVGYFVWDSILVLTGLFILGGMLSANGVTSEIGRGLLGVSGSAFTLSLIILWGAALLSCVVDNVALTLILLPMVTNVISPELSLEANAANPLVWALLFGVSLGTSGSLHGSEANIMLASIARKNGSPVSDTMFLKWGLPLMIFQLIICSVYIKIMFF